MKALLIIDMQKDFMPGGPLEIPEADALVPVINDLMDHFDLIIATQDWHPNGHCSFASSHIGKKVGDIVEEQILWPDHCVQESNGADLAAGINVSKIAFFVKKGSDRGIDSYSAFYDNRKLRSTELDDYLKKQCVDTLYLCGVATDYCVYFTALDALDLGYKVVIIQDACRGLDLGAKECFSALIKKGAKVIHSSDLYRT